MKNKWYHRIISAALSLVIILGVVVLGTDRINAAAETVTYQSHVQDIGWQGWVSNGAVSGTSGQSKRLEAMQIKLENVSGSIEYRTHVQDIGWMGWVSDGASSGTSGQSKRLEAIQIRLTGAAADTYDVYYHVHAENYGWLDWAKNGASAGTAGYGYRLEAIQIVLISKGLAAPGAVNRSFVDLYAVTPTVSYQTHVQDVGWQSYVSNGALSGTTGQSRRLEAIHIKLENMAGSIEYRTHVQDIGWMGWAADGALSGTSGQSKRLEAIQIRLTGAAADQYDVYYRVHAQNFGWLDWAKNGESAGTAAYSYRLEAIEIELVPKGTAAPGPTTQPFVQSECKIYQLPNHDAEQSMGYVIKTASGKVVVIDGGSTDVTPDLLALIRALGGTVDAWLVTHPHEDHVTAMMNIMNQNSDVHVKKIYGSLVSYEKAVEYKDYAADNVLTFNNFISKHQDIFTSVNTGDILTFDGIQVEVLMASNPEITGNFINNQSVVYKVTTKEKSALFLGDLGAECSDKLLQTAGSQLDSDIVQMAHHGSYGVTQAVYQAITPKICMWPCPTWLWNNQPAGSAYNSGSWVTIEVRGWMDSLGATNVVAKDGYASIEIAGKKIIIKESKTLQTLLLP